jgi:hypothetical protein
MYVSTVYIHTVVSSTYLYDLRVFHRCNNETYCNKLYNEKRVKTQVFRYVDT